MVGVCSIKSAACLSSVCICTVSGLRFANSLFHSCLVNLAVEYLASLHYLGHIL